MFALVLDVGRDFRQVGFADAECAISILPRKTAHLWQGILDPFGRAAFQQLQGFAHGLRGWQGQRKMNVIRHSANQQGLHTIFAGNAAKEFPDTFLKVMCNPRFTVFGAENDVIMKRSEGICHAASLANCWRLFNRRSATEMHRGAQIRGLKAPATIMGRSATARHRPSVVNSERHVSDNFSVSDDCDAALACAIRRREYSIGPQLIPFKKTR